MRKIMIIDDDKEFLKEIDELLRLSGYETVFESNSDNAMAKIHLTRPDVILVDLKMHPVSGFKIASELKNLPDNDIPVVAITGFYTHDEHKPLMRICGINKCLVKPVRPLEIIAAIEDALAKKTNRLEDVI